MKKLSLLLSALICLPAALPAQTVVEEIVAKINNDVITRSELQRSREQLMQEARQAGQEAKAAEKEKDVLRDLIDRQLLLQKGKDLGITGEADVVKQLDQLRKDMKLETMEDLEKAASAQGVSFEEYKQNMRDQIVTQQVISREVGGHIHLPEEELKQFYEQHKQELQEPEQVRLSEILIAPAGSKTPDGKEADPTPEAVAAAEQKAKAVLERIRKGEKFEDVAKTESNGPSAADAGDLGFFKRGTLAKQLEDTTFAMKAGDVSDVIRTRQGFVILKVTEHSAGGVPPLKEVEPRVQEALYMQKLQPALRTYLTKLREDAFIDIKPGYLDTGASPNQTAPVVTNTVAADAKSKLKRKKKLGLF
jgi:peptidyl-prolyl cis-trans isomerase SurA